MHEEVRGARMRAPRYGRRLSAAVAAVALGATALMGVAVSAASAAPSNIDPSTPRSLTIHKLSQPATAGVAGDGSELAPESLPADALPLNGVEFTVQQVTAVGGKSVDLNTDAGWATIQPYLNGTTPFVPGNATLGAPVKQVTANGGLAVFNTLPVGLFYVTETNPGPNSIKAPAQPFLVTLPMPTKDPGVFRYDVHAYPKNTLGDQPYMVKTVDDRSAHAVGDTVTWTVSIQIPNSQGYVVDSVDFLDRPEGWTWGEYNRPYLLRTGVGKAWSGPEAKPDLIYFTEPGGVRTDGSSQCGSPGGPAFFCSGEGIKPGTLIELVYETKVNELPANGVVRNQAEVGVNETNMTSESQTLWGKAQFTKHAVGDTSKVLAGAEFQIFADKAAADAAAARVAAGQPVTTGLTFETSTFNPDAYSWIPTRTQTLTSDANGIVTVPGLKASQAGIKYWAVETKAPAGYVASTTPTEFTVTPSATPTGAAAVHVPNQMRQAGALPVLGGAGMTAIGIGGAILIAGGLLFAVFGRRKRDTEHTPAAA
ncbi:MULTISPECIES: SpaH/EbpB family LPXTG-anchored major pilin [unclassified Leucobacter]|uniref:SpaH/EbpB family LPXTG-anchored major pilin n=1 Tax=unclassified Leucobacter TaxID=2621730 RepID=UPI0030188B06